jgi:hypothetical protein
MPAAVGIPAVAVVAAVLVITSSNLHFPLDIDL